MKRLILIGENNEISHELKKKYSTDYEVITHNRKSNIFSNNLKNQFKEGDKIVYTSGILRNKPIEKQLESEIIESFKINTIIPVLIMKFLNQNFIDFVFLFISSESAKKGSFDDSYFLSKNSTTKFIKEFRLKSEFSRILSISPSTIDTGMTNRRSDKERLNQYKNIHPKKRFIKTFEIVEIISFLISDKCDYITNENIEINGGKFARKTI